jgi:hypothetical protein
MHDSGRRWIARIKPTLNSTVDGLLNMPLGLDIWERNEDTIIAAASEAQLDDLERRNLASVERLSTTEDFVAEAQRHEDN